MASTRNGELLNTLTKYLSNTSVMINSRIEIDSIGLYEIVQTFDVEHQE